MKYIKAYETIENNPQIEDFVICDEMPTPDDVEYPLYVKKFVDNNIGKYIKQLPNNKEYSYLIQYDNVPEEYQQDIQYGEIPNSRAMKREEIIYFSKNKQKLIPYLTALKYNF